MKMENNVTEENSDSGTRGCYEYLRTCWDCLVRNRFLASSLTAVALGIALAFILKLYVPMTEFNQFYIGFPGEILMQMLQMVTVPLIVTSVITGVSGLSNETSRRTAVRAAAYFASTTLLAVTLGLILVLSIKPGLAHAVSADERDDEEAFSAVDALMDLVRNVVPPNLLTACFLQYKTERVESDHLEMNATEVLLEEQYVDGANLVGLIVWSFIFGVTLNRIGEKGKVLIEVLTVTNEAIKSVVSLILGYLPLGVLFLITSHFLEVHDWETTFKLGKFMLVVVLGLIIHATILLPLIYFLCVRRNPISVIKGVFPALLTALVISSSSATLPLTFQCCEERLKMDKRITRFMLPIGTNLNMNGTAIYEAVAVVFIAQLNHIHLDFSQLITIAVTTAVCSITAGGIPATGAVTTLFVLTAVGLPARDASILVAVEWLLDRGNTMVNVMGDCIGVAIIDQVSKRELGEMEERGQEMTSMHDSDAESRAPDEIQVHISSQDSDVDGLYHLEGNDEEEHTQGEEQPSEDSGFVMRSPSEYLSAQDSDDDCV